MGDRWSPRGVRSDEEARRRADIVRRYAALAPPSPEDDARFAEELGLTVDSLLRLAAAWRIHAGRTPVRGARTRRPGIAGEAGGEIMAVEIDMDGVDPTRRDETLRRIRVIQNYLSQARPDAPSRDEAAAMIGVSDNRFDALVREWTLHRRASSMPGATVAAKRWHRLAADRRRVHEMLADIVAASGERASVKSIHDELRRRCAVEGLKPLGISRTHDIVRGLRKADDAVRSDAGSEGVTPPPAPSQRPRRSREEP